MRGRRSGSVEASRRRSRRCGPRFIDVLLVGSIEERSDSKDDELPVGGAHAALFRPGAAEQFHEGGKEAFDTGKELLLVIWPGKSAN